MKVYLVNSKYCYTDLNNAIEKAKDILHERGGTSTNYTITKGKNYGYCVHLNEDWKSVGNKHLLNVIIRVIKTENRT